MMISKCCKEEVTTQDCENGAYYVCAACKLCCGILFSLDLELRNWNDEHKHQDAIA
jgi:transcription initiation factor TFIIIB Brf1 subunit/transcription initiation factor TFIIB